HLTDTERLFVYRALCIARGDTQSLPGFEEDDYVRGAAFDSLPFSKIIAEFQTVRAATISFFENLNDQAWSRKGTANGSGVSVRAIAYILAGHERHHRQVLKDRYLDAVGN
nr:DinB family protein [Gemmatimonadaceae bacterium]